MTLWLYRLGFLFLKIWKFLRNHQCFSCYSFNDIFKVMFVSVCMSEVRQIFVDLNFKTDLFYDSLQSGILTLFRLTFWNMPDFYPHQFYTSTYRAIKPLPYVCRWKTCSVPNAIFFLQRLFAEKWGSHFSKTNRIFFTVAHVPLTLHKYIPLKTVYKPCS